MLPDTFKGKDLSQFFTPQEVVASMLDLAWDNPDGPAPGIERSEPFLVACARSGGFLIATYEDLYDEEFGGSTPSIEYEVDFGKKHVKKETVG